MQEKRRHERRSDSLKMSIRMSDGKVKSLVTRDISDGGIFLLARPEEKLPIGTQVAIFPAHYDADSKPPSIMGRIARLSAQGMGIEFLEKRFV